MVRRQPTLRLAIRYALRHPVTALRLARSDVSRLFLILVRSLPRSIRGAGAGVVLGLTEPALRRRGDHHHSAPMTVLALDVRGDRATAMARAAAIGTSASRRTSVALARQVLALGDPALAEQLLSRHPDTGIPSERELRGAVAASVGAYREALRLLDAPGAVNTHRTSARLIRRLQGELAVLDPGWRPAGLGATAVSPPAPRRGTILHLLTNSLPYRQSGYTLRAQAVARAQLAAGLDPQMATRAGFPANEGVVGHGRTDTIDGVAYHRIRPDLPPEQPIDRVAEETVLGVERLIQAIRPSAIQPTTNYVNAQAALVAGGRFGLPVVYEVRGFLEETWLSGIGGASTDLADRPAAIDSDRYALTRAAETSAMVRADAVVTLSETMRADIIDRGVPAAKVHVIPNAVDLERFTPGPRDADLAAELGIDPDEIVIGYISSLIPYEGVRYLIEAFALLVEAGRRVRLVVVGDGVELAGLRAQADAAGLIRTRAAIFPGRVPFAVIDRYYRLIDVFVVPRTADRVSQLVTPLKPYEAMAMEKALVVSDVAALREIVTDGETGRVFRVEDPAALAEILTELASDAAQRERLGRAARVWVGEHRTWAINGQRYLDLYRALGVA